MNANLLKCFILIVGVILTLNASSVNCELFRRSDNPKDITYIPEPGPLRIAVFPGKRASEDRNKYDTIMQPSIEDFQQR